VALPQEYSPLEPADSGARAANVHGTCLADPACTAFSTWGMFCRACGVSHWACRVPAALHLRGISL